MCQSCCNPDLHKLSAARRALGLVLAANWYVAAAAAGFMQRNSKLVAQQLLERPPPHHQRRHFKKPPATTEAAAAAEGEGRGGDVEGGTGLAPDASSRLELLRQKYGKKSMDTGATGFAAWQQQQQQQQAGWREGGEERSVVHADSSPRDPAQAA
jgi:hypothetical protein